MSEVKDGLHMIPEYMWKSVIDWAEKAEPHPRAMGKFFHAVLINDFMGSVVYADPENMDRIREWGKFLYNYLPGPSWGTEAKLLEWYKAHHPEAK